ncbi:MAG: TRAP transporter TatT component family protein [Thermoanaerobaculia bacterium]|nr:TRAP transporter TatT component family protein [Thermoanaerobaculia bacterium]
MLLVTACSPRRYAARTFARTLDEASMLFLEEEDLALAGAALPFALKMDEVLLEQAPGDRRLLQSACRGFTLYAWGWVDTAGGSEPLAGGDRRQATARAARLYLRGLEYCLQGLDAAYPGFRDELARDPQRAAARLSPRHAGRDLPLVHGAVAAIFLANAADGAASAHVLARLGEAEALLERALELDESWDRGALHELRMRQLAAKPEPLDDAAMGLHFRRARALSQERRAGVWVTWAETYCVAHQSRDCFLEHLDRALELYIEDAPRERLANGIAQRRARLLKDRTADLILEAAASGGGG